MPYGLDPTVLSDHSTWTEGDFTLVSSDHVVFKVPSRVLLSVSNVLADAVEAGSGEKYVHFTDNDESSEVIDRFLALAVQDELSPALKGKLEYCSDVARLIKFMVKYDCPRLKSQFLLCLVEHLAAERLSPAQVFALASNLDAPLVCVTALEKACFVSNSEIMRPTKNDSQPHGPLQNASSANPSAMPASVFHLIRPGHAWAWHRAWELAVRTEACPYRGGKSHVTRDISALVPEFKLALKSAEFRPT